MGTILNSKTFFIPKNELLPRDDIVNWLFLCGERRLKDCNLVIRLETADNCRKTKASAEDELKQLLPDDNFNWGYLDYEFYFGQNRYLWKGREIYVTPSEALFLYRWIILGDQYAYKNQPHYLIHLRQKLGKDFLMEVQEEKEDGNRI